MADMPINPKAGVAGPGKFSVRTDKLTLPSASYGEGAQTQQIAQGAPMEKAANVAGAQASQVRAAAAQAPVTSLYAPTERPNEPITHGINIGPGGGSDVLGMNNMAATPDDARFRATMMEYLPVLTYITQQPNTSPETRAAIASLIDNI